MMRKSETHKIVIFDETGWAAIAGPIKPLVKLIASYNLNFELDSNGHLKSALTHHPLFHFDQCERVVVCTALVPPIIAALRDAGYRPDITHVGTLNERFGAAQSTVAKLSAPWDRYAAAIDSNPEGLIEVCGTKSLITALATMSRLYPEQQILVLAATYSQARWLCNKLWHALGERIGLQTKQWRSTDRIVVANYAPPGSAGRFSIVVAAFANEIAGVRAIEALMHIFKKVRRRYVFKLSHRPLDGPERVAAQALFGDTIWSEKKETSIPVRALCFYTIGFGSMQSEDGLDYKRLSIWQNEGRNAFIAIAATALLSKDVNVLGALGLSSVQKLFPQKNESDSWRVGILVEGTEHAAALKQILEWPVMLMAA